MPSVLIVDPDLRARETLCAIFLRDGYQVTTCCSGHEAIDRLRSAPCETILVDLHLSDMGGIQLLQMIRAEGLRIPCAIMTASATLQSAIDAIRLGAIDYIEKPISERIVASLARRLSVTQPETAMTAAAISNRAITGCEPRVSEALAFVERNFADDRLDLPRIARHLKMSPEHLCRLVKRHTGSGFSIHLRQTRIQEAKRLLCETHLSVKEVASRTGYSVPRLEYHFRRVYGTAPREFRKSQLKNGNADVHDSGQRAE